MRPGKDTWTGCSALLWHGAGSVPLAKSHSQSSETGSAEWGKKGLNGTAHLFPGARLSVHASSSLELACPVCAAGRTSQGC